MMAIIAFTSASGAPGVTTTALGMTLTWHRPPLFVEASTAGGSAVLAGYWRGRVRHDSGLVDLAEAYRAGEMVDGIYKASLPLPDGAGRVLPGVRSVAQLDTVSPLWGPLGSALSSIEQTGTDVLIDAGRLGSVHTPVPLLQAADLVLVLTRTDMPSITHTRVQVAELRKHLILDGLGHDSIQLLLVGRGEFGAREVRDVVGAPVLGTIADQPDQAAVITYGAKHPTRPWWMPWRSPQSHWRASTFVRSLNTCGNSIVKVATNRRDLLAPTRENA